MASVTFLAILLSVSLNPAVFASPQTYFLSSGCSRDKYNPSSFIPQINATFSDLRSTLSGSPSSLFATASDPPVYALFQCRAYLSLSDCLSCFSTAATYLLPFCAPFNGGRVSYDGCILRYEAAAFFDEGSYAGNSSLCGNRTTSAAGFSADVDGLMLDLSEATPRIPRYFAAAVRDGVYGVAQCVESVTEETCGACLAVAYKNIKDCLQYAEARAVDGGCFMRYSDKAFFPANQTVDLAPFLNSGSSSKKGAIIGGVAGAVGGMMLIALVALLWIRKPKKSQNSQRGNILDATELRGPLKFRYADLKAATGNFNKKNKLGEGGFGDVYKVIMRQ